MEFESIQQAINKKEPVWIRGWVKRRRNMKDLVFFVLRDSTNVMQCVIDKAKVNQELFDLANKTTIESSIQLHGTIEPEERAPNKVELKVDDIKIVQIAEDFPIQKDFSEDHLLNYRHLWLRSTKLAEALKCRSTIFRAFHDFMRQEGYTEIHNPSFVSGAVEGGSTLFEVPYFGKTVFLTQSGQFYNEAYAMALEKVYTIGPSYRAEKSRTRRHLTEFWHAEWETAWSQLPDLLDFSEKLIKYLVKDLVEKNPKQLETLGRDIKKLEPTIENKFERFKYDEILEMAQKKFKNLEWGADLGEKEEREITKEFDTPIIVTHYPKKIKPFYHRPDPDNPEVVLCCDMLAPEGYGEIIGAGERCWTIEEIGDRIQKEGLNPEDYEWYLDLRRYGAVPHSGAGLGLARTLTWICSLPHIRDVIGFPRTMNRYYP